MGSLSIWHWLIVGAVALLLFGGKGKISELMGDVAKGIKSFKKGMAEEDQPEAPHPADTLRKLDHQQIGQPIGEAGKVSDPRKIG
jgi:sec-independent protein translocase protein TatA